MQFLEIEIGVANPKKNENENKNDFGLFYWWKSGVV